MRVMDSVSGTEVDFFRKVILADAEKDRAFDSLNFQSSWCRELGEEDTIIGAVMRPFGGEGRLSSPDLIIDPGEAVAAEVREPHHGLQLGGVKRDDPRELVTGDAEEICARFLELG